MYSKGYFDYSKAQSPYSKKREITGPYLKETLAYQARVEADGGEIISIADVDVMYRAAKAGGYLNDIKVWYSPQAGIKKVAGARSNVTKLYDLSSNAWDGQPRPAAPNACAKYMPNMQNGRSSLLFYGLWGSHYIVPLTSPIQTPDTIFTAYRSQYGACLFASGWNTEVQAIMLLNGSWLQESIYIHNASTGAWATYNGAPYCAPTISAVVYNGASSSFWVNGERAFEGDLGTADDPEMTLGCRYGGAEYGFCGDIFEFMVLSGDKTVKVPSISNDINRRLEIFQADYVDSITTISGIPLGGCPGIAKSGDYIYLLQNTIFRSVNVSNKAQPVVTQTIETPSYATALVVDGNYAYIVFNSGTNTPTGGVLRIVDISNPAAMTIVGGSGVNLPAAEVITKSGNYLYIGGFANGGLSVVDVTNPAAPALVASLVDPPLNNAFNSVAVSGNYLYAGFEAGAEIAVRVIDITDPTDPTDVTVLGSNPGEPRGMKISNGYAYSASWFYTNGFTVQSLANPVSPVIVASHPLPNVGYTVTISGNYAFVGMDLQYIASYGGVPFEPLLVIDITDPEHPVTIGNLSGCSVNAISSIIVEGRYAYISELGDDGRLKIVDLIGLGIGVE